MFCTGDLVRIPSHVGLFKMSNGTFDHYEKTKKPRMGIFLNYQNKDECVVYLDGQNWLVEAHSIRMMEKKW
jgi:hypothetical protein